MNAIIQPALAPANHQSAFGGQHPMGSLQGKVKAQCSDIQRQLKKLKSRSTPTSPRHSLFTNLGAAFNALFKPFLHVVQLDPTRAQLTRQSIRPSLDGVYPPLCNASVVALTLCLTSTYRLGHTLRQMRQQHLEKGQHQEAAYIADLLYAFQPLFKSMAACKPLLERHQ